MIKMRMLTNEEFGIHLKTMRKSRDMTQKDLGDAIGQSAASIGMYENGQRMPDRETIEAIADVFNVGTHSLLFTEPTIDDIDAYIDALPKTEEARILSKGVDQLPEEQRKQAVAMFDLMFSKFLKDKGDDKNDT